MTVLSLLDMSLTGGVLIAAVVILRAVAVHRLPKRAFLALWGVALLRLVLPFALPSPTSVYSAADTLGFGIRRAGIAAGGGAPAVSELSPAAQGGSLPALPLVWAAGAAGLALFFLVTHLRARRTYGASLPVDDPFPAAWLAAHPLRRAVRIRRSDQIDTPLTYGLIRPVILLPKALDGQDPQRLTFVLAHEHTHIRRFDALTKCLLAAALCLHWFNPLVWVMFLLAGRDLELSCDEAVVRMYGPQARGSYARTLLELESRRAPLAPLASAFSKNALEERIGAIMKSRKFSAAALAVAVVLVIAVTALFATSAPEKRQGANTQGAVLSSKEALDKTLNSAVSGITFVQAEEDSFKLDPATGNYYTRAQYDQVAALKTEGYETLSIAEFNRRIHAALNGEDGSDGLWWVYELVMGFLPQDDPLAPFLINTVQPSLTEYSARVSEVYSGKPRDPDFSGTVSRTETADVYGDKVEVGWTQAGYAFTYRILDQDKLTVAERNAFLQSILDGMQAWLDGLDAKDLRDQKAMEKSLLAELDRLGRAATNERIQYTGGKVTDYYSEAAYEDGSGYAGARVIQQDKIATVTAGGTL